MKKMLKIKKSDEKGFLSLIRRFNRVLKNNGLPDAHAVSCGEIDIECVFHATDDTSQISGFDKSFFSVPGYSYVVDVPDGVLKMNGYEFVGSFRLVDDVWMRHMAENPTEADIEYVDERNFRCDHCGKNIRRNSFYFFRKNGEYKVVGSGCGKLFFGMDCEKMLDYLSCIHYFGQDATCQDLSNKSMCFDAKTSIDFAIGVTQYLTRDFSLWQKKDGDNNGTSCHIKRLIDRLSDKNHFPYKEVQIISEYIKRDDFKNTYGIVKNYWDNQTCFNEFAKNAQNPLQCERVPFRWLGIFAYAVFKAMNEHGKQSKSSSISISSHVGQINERITGILTPIKSSPYKNWSNYVNAYVTGSRIALADNDGNEYFSFCTSQNMIDGLEKALNKPVKLRFTVVGHETIGNKKINKINRISLLK